MLLRRKGALNSAAVRRFPRCLQCFPSSAAAARLRNRTEPSVRARTAGGRRSFCTGVFCLAAGWLRSCGGEVTNKSVPLNQEERCVCACACTLLISQSVHVFIPYCPHLPSKQGIVSNPSMHWRATQPSLPQSHLSPPHPIATAGGGHMVHSIYRSPPVVRLQGISVCMDMGAE